MIFDVEHSGEKENLNLGLTWRLLLRADLEPCLLYLWLLSLLLLSVIIVMLHSPLHLHILSFPVDLSSFHSPPLCSIIQGPRNIRSERKSRGTESIVFQMNDRFQNFYLAVIVSYLLAHAYMPLYWSHSSTLLCSFLITWSSTSVFLFARFLWIEQK